MIIMLIIMMTMIMMLITYMRNIIICVAIVYVVRRLVGEMYTCRWDNRYIKHHMHPGVMASSTPVAQYTVTSLATRRVYLHQHRVSVWCTDMPVYLSRWDHENSSYIHIATGLTLSCFDASVCRHVYACVNIMCMLWCVYMYVCKCFCTWLCVSVCYTHTHTHTDTDTHTHKHIHTQTHTHTNTYTHIHTRTCTQTHTHTLNIILLYVTTTVYSYIAMLWNNVFHKWYRHTYG